MHVRDAAGRRIPTPGAQAQGIQRCELSLRLHADGDPWRIAEAHRYCAPPLLFAAGGAVQGPLGDGARLLEVDDPAVVVTALEPRLDGRAQIRVLNASGRARRVSVRWCGRGGGLERVDLRGQPGPGAALSSSPDRRASLELRPWEIAGLRPTSSSS